PNNKPLLAKMPKVFASRGPTNVSNATYYQVFVGGRTMFEPEVRVPFNTIIDGASHTILALQGGEPVPWTKPEDIPFTPGKRLPKLSGPLKGGFLALMADGSVHFVSDKVEARTLEAFIIRNDGQPLRFEDLHPKKD